MCLTPACLPSRARRGVASGLALGAGPIAIFIFRRVGTHVQAAPVGQLAVLAAFVLSALLVSASAPAPAAKAAKTK